MSSQVGQGVLVVVTTAEVHSLLISNSDSVSDAAMLQIVDEVARLVGLVQHCNIGSVQEFAKTVIGACETLGLDSIALMDFILDKASKNLEENFKSSVQKLKTECGEVKAEVKKINEEVSQVKIQEEFNSKMAALSQLQEVQVKRMQEFEAGSKQLADLQATVMQLKSNLAAPPPPAPPPSPPPSPRPLLSPPPPPPGDPRQPAQPPRDSRQPAPPPGDPRQPASPTGDPLSPRVATRNGKGKQVVGTNLSQAALNAKALKLELEKDTLSMQLQQRKGRGVVETPVDEDGAGYGAAAAVEGGEGAAAVSRQKRTGTEPANGKAHAQPSPEQEFDLLVKNLSEASPFDDVEHNKLMQMVGSLDPTDKDCVKTYSKPGNSISKMNPELGKVVEQLLKAWSEDNSGSIVDAKVQPYGVRDCFKESNVKVFKKMNESSKKTGIQFAKKIHDLCKQIMDFFPGCIPPALVVLRYFHVMAIGSLKTGATVLESDEANRVMREENADAMWAFYHRSHLGGIWFSVVTLASVLGDSTILDEFKALYPRFYQMVALSPDISKKVDEERKENPNTILFLRNQARAGSFGGRKAQYLTMMVNSKFQQCLFLSEDASKRGAASSSDGNSKRHKMGNP